MKPSAKKLVEKMLSLGGEKNEVRNSSLVDVCIGSLEVDLSKGQEAQVKLEDGEILAGLSKGAAQLPNVGLETDDVQVLDGLQ